MRTLAPPAASGQTPAMPRNKLNKTWEKVARQNGLLGDIATPRVTPSDQHLPKSSTFARLTLPPSTNNLFISVGKRRVKSPEYRRWVSDNAGAVAVLVPPPAFPVRVCLKVCGKVNARRDLDNLVKPTLDLLVSGGVLPDDNVKHVTGGRWDYEPSADEPSVVVWWEAAG